MNHSLFPTDLTSILARMNGIRPRAYGRDRNFVDGHVTRLSPYISRGVISTRTVLEHLIGAGHAFKSIQKMLQELAWRDFWQLQWVWHGDRINEDFKHPQKGVTNHQMPKAIIQAKTGIQAIDEGIQGLYETGYMHNHVRMYVAAVCCYFAGSHWLTPARWMYHHLLDADWGSNALSWQWVAGSNSNKQYFANQQNINKYCHTQQAGTWLDDSYDELQKPKSYPVLNPLSQPALTTTLSESKPLKIKPNKPICIYNFYNMDPWWYADQDVNRVLLLEPKVFANYSVSDDSIRFVKELAKNIPNLKVVVMDFVEFKDQQCDAKLIYKEHPLNRHYSGQEEPREWMVDPKDLGLIPGQNLQSFFKFWRMIEPKLAARFE